MVNQMGKHFLLVLLLGAAEVSAQTRDLEGFWATSTLTPLERPPELAGKAFFTEKEAAEYERRTLEAVNSDRRDGGPDADLRRNYNEFWRDRATTVLPSRRTSIVVDPPDGKIPPFTPDAQRKRAEQVGANRALAGPEALALRIRCISRDLPMIPHRTTTSSRSFKVPASSRSFRR